MRVKFEVPGPPRGKQRPRVVRTGKFTRTYTPQETVVYENLIKMCYLEQVGRKTLEGPIRAEVKAFFPIPKSTSKKKHEQMAKEKTYHTKKPDADNVLKVVADSLNGVAYHDDAGIAETVTSKVYSDNPRIEVVLEELGEESE